MNLLEVLPPGRSTQIWCICADVLPAISSVWKGPVMSNGLWVCICIPVNLIKKAMRVQCLGGRYSKLASANGLPGYEHMISLRIQPCLFWLVAWNMFCFSVCCESSSNWLLFFNVYHRPVIMGQMFDPQKSATQRQILVTLPMVCAACLHLGESFRSLWSNSRWGCEWLVLSLSCTGVWYEVWNLCHTAW